MQSSVGGFVQRHAIVASAELHSEQISSFIPAIYLVVSMSEGV
jgi:hypothetical protein